MTQAQPSVSLSSFQIFSDMFREAKGRKGLKGQEGYEGREGHEARGIRPHHAYLLSSLIFHVLPISTSILFLSPDSPDLNG